MNCMWSYAGYKRTINITMITMWEYVVSCLCYNQAFKASECVKMIIIHNPNAFALGYSPIIPVHTWRKLNKIPRK